MTDKYNPNDLGYITNNNSMESGAKVTYNVFKPFGRFNNLQNAISLSFNRLYKPSVYIGLNIDAFSIATFKNNSVFGIHLNGYPNGMKDYYEPRIPGRYFCKPGYGFMELIYSSDSRKALKYELFTGLGRQGKIDDRIGQSYWIWAGISPRYRFNDKSSVTLLMRYYKAFNSIGFARTDSLIRFGQRDNMVFENSIKASYYLTGNISFDIRVRHYWSTVKYIEFYTLDSEGYLSESDYAGNHNINFNSFNADMGVTWRFAPGSELTVFWKNSILNQDKVIPDDYFMDLKNMFGQPQMNSISFKAIYYFDYQSLRRGKL